MRGRKDNIDTVRGIACLLLVAYHVVGLSTTTGLRLEDGSVYRMINDSLGYIRMPLFTFLSGVVYAMRPVSGGESRKFLLGKVKRLLLPFVFVGTIFFLVRYLVPGTNQQPELIDILLRLIWPQAHFWFLPALFLIFLTVSALERIRALDSPWMLLAVFAFSCILFQFHYGAVGAFTWNRALYLFPFFLAGACVQRFDVRWAVALVGLAALAPDLKIAIGVGSAVLLLVVFPKVPILAKIGVYSYTIYLYHVFGTAGARIALEQAGISSTPVFFIAGLASGIILPIAVHLALRDVPLANRAFLGIRSRRGEHREVDSALQGSEAGQWPRVEGEQHAVAR